MQKPKGYDKTPIYTDSKTLPGGGYVCKVLKAEEVTVGNGKPQLKAAVDICEGEYTEFFQEKFDRRKQYDLTGHDVKWPFDGTARIWVEDYRHPEKTSIDFKAFVEACRASGKEIIWDDRFASRLKGAEVGIIFRREERKLSDGSGTYWATLPFRYTTAQTIRDGNFKVPEDKPLKKAATVESFTPPEGFAEVDDDIPF